MKPDLRVKCGRLMEYDQLFVGGCDKWVNIMDMFRCTDCTVPFHRKCAIKHFKYPCADKPPKKRK